MSVTRIKVAVMAQGLGDNLTGLPAKITITAVSGSWPAIVVREENVIFSQKGTVLTAAGEEELIIELKPTDGDACYKWTFDPGTGREFTRYTSVPATTEVVDFGALPIVNPKTFRPSETAVAAWEAALANFVEERTRIEIVGDEVANAQLVIATDAEDARTAARYVQGAVKEADDFADEAFKQAGFAKGHADDAAKSEENAAGSAFQAESFLTSIKDYAESSYMSADSAGRSAGAAYLDRVYVGEAKILIDNIHEDVSASKRAVDLAKQSVDTTKGAIDTIKLEIDDSVSTVRTVKQDVLDTQTAIGLTQNEIDETAGRVSTDKGVILLAKDDVLESQRLVGLDKTSVGQSKSAIDLSVKDMRDLKIVMDGLKSDTEKARDISLAGQFSGSALVINADLNTLTAPGVYRAPNVVVNGPSTSFIGVVMVLPREAGSRVIQVAYLQNGGGTASMEWRRTSFGSSPLQWGPWRLVSVQRTNVGTNQPGLEFFATLDNATEVALTPTNVFLGSVDLNLVTMVGSYYAGIANATLEKNYPIASGGGILEVFSMGTSGEILQRFTMHGGVVGFTRNIYQRRRTSTGTWSLWEKASGVKITQGANQPGPLVNLWDDVNLKDQVLALSSIPLGTSDLNGVVTTGSYIQTNTANATIASNYPVASNGVLEVRALGGTSILQQYTPHNGNAALAGRVSYQRSLTGGTWSAWRAQVTQRVDQTAGRAFYTYDDVNGREELIYGDTGWRDVTGLLLNDATATLAAIRRVGRMIYIRFTSLKLPSTAVGDPVYSLPQGFQASAATYAIFRENVNTGNAFGFQVSGATVNLSANVTVTQPNNTTHRFTGLLTSICDQAWPTTLPGAAYGGIPNL